MVAAGISDDSIETPTKRYDLFRRRHFFGAGSLSTWISLWSLESLFLVFAILSSFILSRIAA